MASERENGFYWVRDSDDEWIVAQYSDGWWTECGLDDM